ncbi:metallophosphoesterase [uncultured Thioclava sp.]|uniref:metallophosphoesterase n=1 Tax=uncultured Thioclava sp. TaxID=473858 RepID=UPI0025D83BAD|nr:metallophosphoesterase [uncultured Thioclava sp.]
MTNTLILADLHLDLWHQAGLNPLDQIDFDGVELLIIAGDLTNKPRVRWKQAFALIGERIPLDRVHVFPGNHDYYDFRLDGDDRLAEIALTAGAKYAQKSVIIHGTTRYLCCTLWTDMRMGTGTLEENAAEAARIMNDYRYIRVAHAGFRKARPLDTVALHREHVAWLGARLSEPFAGETVVVTHHAPHPFALSPGGPVPQAYASDLSDLIKRFQPDQWLFGHTHLATEFQIGTTKLRNVSIGYPAKARKAKEPRDG